MKLGVVFPQGEIEADPATIIDFVQAVEDLGFDYLLVYELIIDTRSEKPPAAWQEPFTLLSFIAAVTSKLELATGVSVLPSRPAVLVAKQAAELDRLCQGRLRLGFSVGWNAAEYQALGAKFSKRGQMLEEQIRLMRALWTQPFVTFSGKFHQLREIGVYPAPVQQPIPIWLGGYTDAVLRRIAAMGDGWLSYGLTPETAPEQLDRLHDYIDQAGRRLEDVGLNIVGVDITKPADWGDLVGRWRHLGATHLDVITREVGFTKPQEHLDAIRRFKEALDA